MIYRIIVFLVILTAAITYIVISKRKYERLLKAEMEEINRKEMSRMRNWTAEDYRKYNYIVSIHRNRMGNELINNYRGYTRTTNLDNERGLKPSKHIKRHSIR